MPGRAIPAIGVILPGVLPLPPGSFERSGGGATALPRPESEGPGWLVCRRLPTTSELSSKLEGNGRTLPDDRRGPGVFCTLLGPFIGICPSDTIVLGEPPVGDAVVKCAGFFATGGAGLPFVEFWEATDAGRLGGSVGLGLLTGFLCDGTFIGIVCERGAVVLGAPVCLLGGGGGGTSEWSASISRFSLPALAGMDDGSYGGGSFLGIELDADVDNMVEWLICS